MLALLLVTVIGFISHRETDASFLPRAAAMFVSLISGWFLLAPVTGLFNDERVHTGPPLWRPAVTGFFAAQFAVTVRGLLLQSSVQPIFVVVLGITTAFGMTLWRVLAGRMLSHQKKNNLSFVSGNAYGTTD